MTTDEHGIQIARERLEGLRRQAERIVIDPQKPRRIKDMELAGVNGMIEQVESEIRVLSLGVVCERVDALRARLRDGTSADLGEVMDCALDLVEQLAIQKV